MGSPENPVSRKKIQRLPERSVDLSDPDGRCPRPYQLYPERHAGSLHPANSRHELPVAPPRDPRSLFSDLDRLNLPLLLSTQHDGAAAVGLLRRRDRGHSMAIHTMGLYPFPGRCREVQRHLRGLCPTTYLSGLALLELDRRPAGRRHHLRPPEHQDLQKRGPRRGGPSRLQRGAELKAPAVDREELLFRGRGVDCRGALS